MSFFSSELVTLCIIMIVFTLATSFDNVATCFSAFCNSARAPLSRRKNTTAAMSKIITAKILICFMVEGGEVGFANRGLGIILREPGREILQHESAKVI